VRGNQRKETIKGGIFHFAYKSWEKSQGVLIVLGEGAKSHQLI
jgi:hypothetical protein